MSTDRGALLLLFAGWIVSCLAQDGSIPGEGRGGAEEQTECVFVANLHVRKCGGTTLREHFRQMQAKEGSGWTQSRADDLPPDSAFGYCAGSAAHAHAVQARPNGKYWAEVHCDQDLVSFNAGVEELRAELVGRGCRVVTTLLLRDPVRQAESEWRNFCVGFYADGGGECLQRPEWARDVVSWAAAHPEHLLALLLMGHRDGLPLPAGELDLRPLFRARNASRTGGDAGIGGLHATCDAVYEVVVGELAKIDVLGTVGSGADFARFWRRLSEVVGGSSGDREMGRMPAPGRENVFEHSDMHKRARLQGLSPRVRMNATERADQRAELGRFNECSARVFQYVLDRLKH